jgi:quercetin dioxygenase-like cupin family protein
MPFINFSSVDLEDFRPGIKSWVQTGEQLIMAVMTIEAGMEDAGHSHPFDQSGLVLEGNFTLFIGEDRKSLRPGQGYFIPAGIHHGWSVPDGGPVRVLDVSAKIC